METSLANERKQGWVRTLVLGRDFRFTLVRAACAIGVILLIYKFVLVPVRVTGPSMMPTYRNHSVRLVNRLAYLRTEPKRGDVVAIRYSGESVLLMKRIIGLPGEQIGFLNGRATVNGQVLREPYLVYPSNWTSPPVTVEPGKYFVVGDNRSMPQMDHTFGQADRTRILGRVL